MMAREKIAFLILAVIVIASKADGDPLFTSSWPTFCRVTRLCPPPPPGRPEVPGSIRADDSPSQVPGSITRRAELLLGIANLADFINGQIELNPVFNVLRDDLAIKHGVSLSALAEGKLAGENENELLRILNILTRILPVFKNVRPPKTNGPSGPAVSSTTYDTPSLPAEIEIKGPPKYIRPPARSDTGPPQPTSSEED